MMHEEINMNAVEIFLTAWILSATLIVLATLPFIGYGYYVMLKRKKEEKFKK